MKSIFFMVLVFMLTPIVHAKDACLDLIKEELFLNAKNKNWTTLDVIQISSNRVENLVENAIDEDIEEGRYMEWLVGNSSVKFYIASWASSLSFGQLLFAMGPVEPVLDMPNLPKCEKLSELLLVSQ